MPLSTYIAYCTISQHESLLDTFAGMEPLELRWALNRYVKLERMRSLSRSTVFPRPFDVTRVDFERLADALDPSTWEASVTCQTRAVELVQPKSESVITVVVNDAPHPQQVLESLVISCANPDDQGMKPKEFAKELKRLRIASGLTQQQAARSLGKKHAHAFAAYETGEREPKLSQAEALLKAIGYNLELTVRKR